ncbi:MAG: AAA family ATPase [Candidatus Bathyarchaeota archaeon]|nr:AAA family ATPase [Candidatus Bathyarchaeota archaeon]MDH5779057.1 AAA family ATPase [Candidatus Bathyarchaeota archaeon]
MVLGKEYEELSENGQLEFITFHPSYSYEEFIEGITVNTDQDSDEAEAGEIRYIQKWGVFKKLCAIALAAGIGEVLDPSKESWEDQWSKLYEKYETKTQGKSKEAVNAEKWKNAEKFVLIIDEINRGDISKTFGELVTLLEADKRLAQDNQIVARLPYSGDKFSVPPNLYIVGTMNTADRSIALVDIALRRRFGFVEMAPDFEVLRSDHIEKNQNQLKENNVHSHLVKSVDAVEKINKHIIDELGRDKQIGHSFFFKVWDQKDLMMVWQHEILPLLEEYYYCDYDKILRALDMPPDNPYVSKDVGIKGFTKIEDLDDFLSKILGMTGTSNG